MHALIASALVVTGATFVVLYFVTKWYGIW